MNIERLTLHNFLCYETLYLDLTGAPIHLFLGPNAAGKTTLLDAFRYALLGEARGLGQKKDQWAFIHGIETLSPGDRRTACVSVRLRQEEAVVEIVRKRAGPAKSSR